MTAAQKRPPGGNRTASTSQEGIRTQMHTNSNSPSALAALMETAADCGFTLTIDSIRPGALYLSLVSRDQDMVVPVADCGLTYLADGAILADSREIATGQYVSGYTTEAGIGMAVDTFVAAMHEYFFHLALTVVPV